MRTEVDVMAAQAELQALAARQVDSAVVSYPPGYIAGLGLTIDEHGQIVIGIGAANVAGRSITQSSAYVFDGTEWLTPRVAEKFYYVYVNTERRYYIDAIEPEIVNQYFDYYHPALTRMRNIGKVFLDSSGDITYATSGAPDGYSRTVIVGSSEYGGDADYSCDGTADETEIQMAVDYVDGLGGGIVQLTHGQFNTGAGVHLYANIVLQGDGVATVIKKNCNDYAVSIEGGAGTEIDGVQVKDLTITRDTADTNEIALLYATYADSLVLHNIDFLDAYYYAASIENCDNLMASGCRAIGYSESVIVAIRALVRVRLCTGILQDWILDGDGDVLSQGTFWALYVSYCEGLLITGCVVKNIVNSSGYVAGIYLYDGSGNNCENCIISDLSGEGGNFTAGIYCSSDRTAIHNCRVTDIYGCQFSTPPAALENQNGVGIFCSADECRITNNFISDVGSVGILLAGTAERTLLGGNYTVDNGNLLAYGDCEDHTNAPFIVGDAASSSNATLSTEATLVQEGEGSIKHLVTAGGAISEMRFTDNIDDDDLHGLLPGYDYRLSGQVLVPLVGGPEVGEVELVLAYYDGGAWTEVTVSPTTVTAFEGIVTADVSIPATATGAFAVGRITAVAATDEYVYWDKLSLRPLGIHNEHDNQYLDA